MATAIYKDNDKAPGNPEHIKDVIAPSNFKSAVVDTAYTPKQELLAYIEGSTWVTDYYSRVKGSSEDSQGLDPTLPIPMQQYNRIHSMELKVQQELTFESTTPNRERKITGVSLVYPFLIPQVGDMFRAGVYDGHEGLFVVTRSEPKSMFLDTVHEIEYEMISEEDPRWIGDLDSKVQNTYYFVKDFLLNHQNPMVLEADYHSGQALARWYYDLIYFYFKQYVSREFMTLTIPNQQNSSYDHGLTDFVMSIMDSTHDIQIQSIRRMNISDDSAIKAPSLWDMFLRRDPKMRKYIYQHAGIVPTRDTAVPWAQTALMSGIQWTRIRFIVYPIEPLLNNDLREGLERLRYVLDSRTVERLKKKLSKLDWNSVNLDGFKQASENDPPKLGIAPSIWPVNFSGTYVLSEAFYDKNRAGMSKLELLLDDLLDHKLIRNEDVLKLAEECYDWDRLDQFYLIPLLLLIIRYSIRRL